MIIENNTLMSKALRRKRANGAIPANERTVVITRHVTRLITQLKVSKVLARKKANKFGDEDGQITLTAYYDGMGNGLAEAIGLLEKSIAGGGGS